MTEHDGQWNKSTNVSDLNKTAIEKDQQARRMSTRKITSLAILSALAVIFMFFETALPFMPPFLKLDISEIPVLLGAFAFGPGSAVIIELIKNLIHLPFTQTAGVGELANFLAGSIFTVTAGAIYHFYRNRRGAIAAMAAGTISMTVFSSFFNYYFMLDFYSRFYGMPMDTIVAMSAAVNVYVKDIKTLIVFAFIPFNLFKGLVVSVLTAVIYKRVSPLLHGKKGMAPAASAPAVTPEATPAVTPEATPAVTPEVTKD